MNRPDNRSGMNPIERQRILRLQQDNARFNSINNIGGGISDDVLDELLQNSTDNGSVDGGFAASVYLVPQLIDGGKANNGEPDTNPA